MTAAASTGPFDPTTDLGRSYLDVDWGATALGALDTWSDSLNSSVRLMLSSRFAMWMGWGDELTFFCNEAYRRDSLGGKYPWALGRPTAQVWSEIWSQITDRVEAVTVAGESTWDEELRLFVQRSGYLEETYHTFSYSPVTEGATTIVGLLCVVNEVTEGVVDGRRIATLSALSQGLAVAATEADVCAAAQTAVGANADDFPFAAAYVYGRDRATAELAWTCGASAGGRPNPQSLVLQDAELPWPAAARIGGVQLVDDVGAAFADLAPSPQGGTTTRAVVAPLSRAGTTDELGFLVVGASAHRPPDERYVSFVGLVADQFAAALTRARAAAAERDHVERVAAREHAIAQELQRSLLPAREFAADHLDVATFYRAGGDGAAVGGGWYDVIDLGPGRTALVVADVAGSGVQAAAIMGQLRASVRAWARLELAPDVVLGLLDESVRERAEHRAVTCFYGIYDPTELTLTYANAGHQPPLLSTPGQPTRPLPDGDHPLGSGRRWPTPQTVTLPVGSTLTLYTDGLWQRLGGDVRAGVARAQEVLDAGPVPVEELPARLVEHVLPGDVPGDGDDDLALLFVRVSERARRDRFARLQVEHDPAHVARARAFVAERLTEWQVGADLLMDAQLVVSELVTNALLHADTEAELTVRIAGSRLFVEVHDRAATAPRPRNALPSETNGRGLAIVAALATRWGTRQTPQGKAIWCEFALAPAYGAGVATHAADLVDP